MDISFSTSKLAKIFNDGERLIRVYGSPNAKKIVNRMALLKASRCLDDVPSVPPCRCHPLHHNREGQFSVDLAHPFRLIFVPNHNPLPQKEDGDIDLKQVMAITIIEVEDYH